MACAASSLTHMVALTLLPPPGSLSGAPAAGQIQTVMIDLMPPPQPPPPEAAPAEEPKPKTPVPDPEEEQLEVVKQLALGIDADTPDSDTWLGHDTFIEHRAVPADFDQAAFTTDATASAPPPSIQPTPADVPPAPISLPPEQLADAPLPQDVPPAPARDSDVPTEMSRDVEPDALPFDDGTMPEFASQDAAMAPAATESGEEEAKAQAEDDPQRVFEAVMTALGLTMPPPPSTEVETPALSPQPTVTPPTDSDPSVGERSDKQSDPTSIINVPRDKWQLGQPLAAHGLQLKPVKPKLTVLTSMTAAPCNPLAVLRFEGSGVPKDVTLLQGSCDSRVDEAVLSALYRWRAEGEELLTLRTGETIDIRIRLILNPRGRVDDDVKPE